MSSIIELDQLEIIWLAGLLEGEGNFDLTNGKYPRITLGMTDKDVVDKFANICGVSTVTKQERRFGWSTIYVATVCGNQAVYLMGKLKPHMGDRRKSKIEECLYLFENRQTKHYKART